MKEEEYLFDFLGLDCEGNYPKHKFYVAINKKFVTPSTWGHGIYKLNDEGKKAFQDDERTNWNQSGFYKLKLIDDNDIRNMYQKAQDEIKRLQNELELLSKFNINN